MIFNLSEEISKTKTKLELVNFIWEYYFIIHNTYDPYYVYELISEKVLDFDDVYPAEIYDDFYDKLMNSIHSNDNPFIQNRQ